MRICLLTGGGYPYRRDALGGWCRTLVDGLRHVTFELLSVTDREPPAAPAYPLPMHVTSARAVLIRPAPEARRRGPADRDATAAAAMLCQGLMDETDSFAHGLRQLALLPDAPLSRVPLAELLLEAWRTGPADHRPLPRLSPRDARTAATLLHHAARVLAVPVPAADLVHCVGGTTPLLAALAGRWRNGGPLLLTEARAPVARLRPAEERLSPAVRAVLHRFREAATRAGYAEAGLIAPLSAYHHSWALRHGARPSRLVPVPAGAKPVEYPNPPENAPPALVWAGGGGPDSGLGPLLHAFRAVVAAVPDAVLHLVGVLPTHQDDCAEQVDRTGLGRAVRMHPLPADPNERYAAGHVVVHMPGPADPPYRLVEAMMSGRAVIGVDVGPTAETLGEAGLLVRPDDPAALATACIALLRSPTRRRSLGDAARRRALAYFTSDRVVRAYGALYSDLAGPPPEPQYELALSVTAPRTALPATMRWLTSTAADHRSSS
jgi:glycosyltransferase involved in cell wall biosynthesis